MIACAPVTSAGEIDHRWGRARRVAIGEVRGAQIVRWDEVDVGWDTLHDEGTEGGHHARVARFLKELGVDLVAARRSARSDSGSAMPGRVRPSHVTVTRGSASRFRYHAVAGPHPAATQMPPSAAIA